MLPPQSQQKKLGFNPDLIRIEAGFGPSHAGKLQLGQSPGEQCQRTSLEFLCLPRVYGFTLTELLAVLVITAILLALLFPSVKSFQAASAKAQCASNMKQIGAALFSYASENNGSLPAVATSWPPSGAESTWGRAIWEYAGYQASQFKFPTFDLSWRTASVGNNIFRCPSNRNAPVPVPGLSVNPNRQSYGLNASPRQTTPPTSGSVLWTTPIPLVRIESPAKTAMVTECSYSLGDHSGYFRFYGLTPHSKGANVLYYDGHVEWLPFGQIPTNRNDVFWSGKEL